MAKAKGELEDALGRKDGLAHELDISKFRFLQA